MKHLKLIVLSAVMLCGTSLSTRAQETKHEVGISYGVGSTSTILSFLEDIMGITLSSGSVRYDNDKYFGPLAAEYFYHLSPSVGVGGVLTYVNTKKDLLTGNTKIGEAKVNYFTVMPAMKMAWFDNEHCSMYSKLAAGVSFRHDTQEWNDNGAKEDSQNDVFFNFQVSLVGIEAGSKTVRGFAELGFGEQGILLAGLRCKF